MYCKNEHHYGDKVRRLQGHLTRSKTFYLLPLTHPPLQNISSKFVENILSYPVHRQTKAKNITFLVGVISIMGLWPEQPVIWWSYYTDHNPDLEYDMDHFQRLSDHLLAVRYAYQLLTRWSAVLCAHTLNSIRVLHTLLASFKTQAADQTPEHFHISV